MRVRLWHTSGCHSSRPAWRQDRRHIAHALAGVLVQKENVLTASAMTAFGLLLASTLVASIRPQSEASGRQLQTAACFDDSQCSYNGVCQSSACVCDDPWGGTNCDKLAAGVVDKSVYGYRQGFPYTTSSGGSALWDSVSGKYIMAVSEYAAECPNAAHNSAIAIATSTNVEGPYVKQFRVFGVGSLEPMLTRTQGGTGAWALYFTAKRVADTGQPAKGADSDNIHGTLCTRTNYASKCSCPDGQPDLVPTYPSWLVHTPTPLDYASWQAEPCAIIIDPILDFVFNDHKCINGQAPASPTDELRSKSIYSSYHGVAKLGEGFVGLWRTWECTSDLCADNHYATLGTPQGAASKCFSVIHPVFGHDWSEPSSYHYPLIDSDGWHYSADTDLKAGAHGSAVRKWLQIIRPRFPRPRSSDHLCVCVAPRSLMRRARTVANCKEKAQVALPRALLCEPDGKRP